MLLESKKEQVEKPPEPTQQELVVIASEEAGFSKTVDVGQFIRTRLVCWWSGASRGGARFGVACSSKFFCFLCNRCFYSTAAMSICVLIVSVLLLVFYLNVFGRFHVSLYFSVRLPVSLCVSASMYVPECRVQA